PFNKEEKPASDAFKEIQEKIDKFNNPLLFLRNLQRIEVEANGKKTVFTKKIQKDDSIQLPEVLIQRVKLNNDDIIRFDQSVSVTDKDGKAHSLPINVAFVLDEQGNVTNDFKFRHYFQNAWCYFPTYQETHLSYIVNAPFILTPNREALKEGRI